MTDKPKSLNLQIWLMTAIVAGVIIAGFLVFPKTEDARNALLGKLGTTNHGTFIQPTLDITKLPLWSEDDQPWRHGEQKIKWRLVIADDGQCREACQNALYMTRQVHIRIGKNAQRIERVYLLLDNELSPEMAKQFKTEHPYLKVLKGSHSEYSAWLSGANTEGLSAEAMRILVVDQNGRAMMFYGPEHDGGGVLKDLNHLLKYSPAP